MSDYPEWFSEIWANKPNRNGGNNKRAAFRQAQARLKQGFTPQEMLEGTIRYNNHCVSLGKINGPYVLMMQTFLGRDCHFEEEWQINETPPPSPPSGAAGSKERSQSYLEQLAADVYQPRPIPRSQNSPDMEGIQGNIW